MAKTKVVDSMSSITLLLTIFSFEIVYYPKVVYYVKIDTSNTLLYD